MDAGPARLITRGLSCWLVVIGLLLWEPAAAGAAMEITVDIAPVQPVRGSRVEVIIRTYAPFAEDGDKLPQGSPFPFPSGVMAYLWAGPPYPFNVTILAPSGRSIEVPVAQASDDASAYRGSAVVDESGKWILAVANFPGREWPIEVVEGPMGSTPGLWVTFGGLLAIAISLTAAFVSRSVRIRRRPSDRWVGPPAR